MDIDGEDITQQAREVQDYGIVVDFSEADEGELAVSIAVFLLFEISPE